MKLAGVLKVENYSRDRPRNLTREIQIEKYIEKYK